jgi:hypothetical protein
MKEQLFFILYSPYIYYLLNLPADSGKFLKTKKMYFLKVQEQEHQTKRITIPKESTIEKGETCIVLSLFEYNKLSEEVRQGLTPLNKPKVDTKSGQKTGEK